VGAVHISPAARTAWHSHEGGQTLYVIDGIGLAQARGEDVVEIHPGDVHLGTHFEARIAHHDDTRIHNSTVLSDS
jgi:mannose-6-phosphate isomerase-like protein (cupin superfamily)